MFLHTGERPFRCEYCNYTSVTMSNVRVHTKTHWQQIKKEKELSVKEAVEILVQLKINHQ